MSAIKDYNDACQSAKDALEAGQYGAALISYERAWAAQLQIPDSEFDREKMIFPRESIEKAVEYCKKRAIESGQLTPTGTVNQLRFCEVEYRRG